MKHSEHFCSEFRGQCEDFLLKSLPEAIRSKWRRSYSRKQGGIPFVHLAVRRIIHWIYEVPDPISLQGAAGSASVGKNIED